MSNNNIHEYFNRKSAKWNIVDFLNESKDKPLFRDKIDAYNKSFEKLLLTQKKKKRRESARLLLERYKEAKARMWKMNNKENKDPSIHIHQPRFMEDGSGMSLSSSCYLQFYLVGTNFLLCIKSNLEKKSSQNDAVSDEGKSRKIRRPDVKIQ
ncbi:890_t:CDS:2 [Cetraspora pellucida]|uniref:890_t:CDS:1 n=1 Tax=Cetraspora pellucida TaxID=1433469 RepID=A0ACA9MS73_9GLOM|nr:890_t:CDS:2 [Cetraspora pellucida]